MTIDFGGKNKVKDCLRGRRIDGNSRSELYSVFFSYEASPEPLAS